MDNHYVVVTPCHGRWKELFKCVGVGRGGGGGGQNKSVLIALISSTLGNTLCRICITSCNVAGYIVDLIQLTINVHIVVYFAG